MNTVTIDIDKVKAAAATSPEAKKALQVLCPEAFELPYVTFEGFKPFLCDNGREGAMNVRQYGSLAGRGLFLSSLYVWEIVVDDMGESVLTARRKEGR